MRAGGRILVVDDDRMVRDTVGRVLEEEGYAVEFGEDGADALAKVTADPPDAILLDLMMPGMNGRQFLEALRDDLCREDIPVVVMTAVHGLDVHRAFTLGADDVVEKPFDVDQLLNKVALALFRATEYETMPERPAMLPPSADAGEASETVEGVVLIVDDDRATLRRLDQLLSDRGYTVVSLARVTDELPRLARVLEPQAILLDLDLPGTDGITALSRLRADRSLDHVPILVFADDASDLDRARDDITALDAEGLAKPVADDAVIELVTAPPASASR